MINHIVFCFGQNWQRQVGGANSFEFSIFKEILLLKKKKNFKFTVITSISNKKIIKKMNNVSSNIDIKYYITKRFAFIKSLKLFSFFSIHTQVNSLKPNYAICLGPYYLQTTFNYSSIIWDISHLNSIRHYPEIINNNGIRERDNRIELICKNASHIFVGTDSLAKDLSSFYKFPQINILTNKMPIDKSFLIKESSFKRKDKTIFYPAQIWPHKNHKRLIKAFYNCLNKKLISKSWKLILVGSIVDKQYFDNLQNFIKNYSLESNIEFKGFVSDEYLKNLYQKCHAMIFPTLLGPDNIPPIEALSQNIFMSISDLPGHLEQTGNQVDYHNPNDINSIEKAIIRLSKMSYKYFKVYDKKEIQTSRKYLNKLIKNAIETCNIVNFD